MKKIGMKRKMTSIERKEVFQFQKQKKEVEKIRKKMATTLSWLDIDEVLEDRIILKRGNKTEYVVGFKMEPHNIFIDSTNDFLKRILSIRDCFNQAPDHLYFQFVASPVNADFFLNHVNHLMN